MEIGGKIKTKTLTTNLTVHILDVGTDVCMLDEDFDDIVTPLLAGVNQWSLAASIFHVDVSTGVFQQSNHVTSGHFLLQEMKTQN